MDSWLLIFSCRCFFDSFHSLILFSKNVSSSLFVGMANIIASDAHKAEGSIKGKGYNFGYSSFDYMLWVNFRVLIVPFSIGGCRQTVSSCFLFPCNLILSTEVTGLISINPKTSELISHVLSFLVFKVSWYRLGPFYNRLGKTILCLFSLSIKTSGLMTFQFEIDSIASCSCRRRKEDQLVFRPFFPSKGNF